jgi:hypothetical protein
VIHGIEKTHHANVVFMRTSPRSFGIVIDEVYSAAKYSCEDQEVNAITNNVMAPKQITWLVKKGDLILSNEGRTSEKFFVFHFQESGERRFEVPLYEYEDDDLPDRFQNAQAGRENCKLT